YTFSHTGVILFILGFDDIPHLHSFPTRRSSDLLTELTGYDANAKTYSRLAPFLVDAQQLALYYFERGDDHSALPAADEAEALEQIGRAQSELQSRENLVCRLLLEKKTYHFQVV